MEKTLVSNNCISYKMYDWLKYRIKQISSHLSEAFVFGSVARYSLYPNDCDIMLVAKDDISDTFWGHLRIQNLELSKEFYSEFRVVLSIMLVTYFEYKETNGLMTRIKNGNRLIFEL